MIRDTSKTAYKKINSDGTAKSQKQIIYDMVDYVTKNSRHYGITLKEISRQTGVEINAVAGRVNDLKKEGVIIECFKRRCRITNRTVKPVTINDSIRYVNDQVEEIKEPEDNQEGFGFDIEPKRSNEWPD